MKNNEKQWFTTMDAAKAVEVSQSWIIKMMIEGKIPYVWFGGRRKIAAETVKKLRENGSK